MRTIDLSKLSKAQLLGIRAVLVSGAEATAETKKAKRLRESEAQVKELQREKRVRDVVASYDLDFDDDPAYYLSIPDKVLEFVCKKLQASAREATAEASLKRTFNIPQMGREETVEGTEFIRETLKNRKNGGHG